MRQNSHQRNAGFTLTEAAVVVALIGVVLGAIYGAASYAYNQKLINDIVQQVNLTANNAKVYYWGQHQVEAPGGSDADMNHYTEEIAAGIFPPNFLASSTDEDVGAGYLEMPMAWSGYNFWDGYYPSSYIVGGASTTYVYEEDLINIPDSVCASLAVAFSSEPGITDIVANDTEWGPIYGMAGATAYVSDIPLAEAQTACNSGGANQSQIWIMFSQN